MPAKNNGYIDSPVVSREHATLTAKTTRGTPHVYITDMQSMHGTHVNGAPLVPHVPRLLLNGDKLQFGVEVNRNDSKICFHVLIDLVTDDHQATSLLSNTPSPLSSVTTNRSHEASLFPRPTLRRRNLTSIKHAVAAK